MKLEPGRAAEEALKYAGIEYQHHWDIVKDRLSLQNRAVHFAILVSTGLIGSVLALLARGGNLGNIVSNPDANTIAIIVVGGYIILMTLVLLHYICQTWDLLKHSHAMEGIRVSISQWLTHDDVSALWNARGIITVDEVLESKWERGKLSEKVLQIPLYYQILVMYVPLLCSIAVAGYLCNCRFNMDPNGLFPSPFLVLAVLIGLTIGVVVIAWQHLTVAFKSRNLFGKGIHSSAHANGGSTSGNVDEHNA